MKGRLWLAVLGLAWVQWAQATLAQQPPERFQLPVLCDMERVCSVQLYVDQDRSGQFSDYTCGRLSYDRHNGTDIRVRHLADMERGVTVVAAASGVVVGRRDGMEDVDVNEIGERALDGRFAGNGVGIDHGNGWFTQYSHLRKGSIRVSVGDRVEAGDPLGLIGLSGRTSFPHLEFEVRHNGRPVDPFVGPVEDFTCGAKGRPLWTSDALAAMPYRPAWILNAGFADEAASADQIRRGAYDQTVFPGDSPALVFWANYANALAGDRFELLVLDPAGQTLARSDGEITKPAYTHHVFAGRKRPATGWSPGRYRGVFTLFRESRKILSAEHEISVRR